MFWIVFFLIAALFFWLLVKFVKWLTAPSYIHKVGNVYYKTGNKVLTEREREKLKKMNAKISKK